MDQIKLYIFDLNGTLCNTPFIDKTPLAILPGRKEKLAELQAGGAQLAIASNQGGVAFGFQTESAAWAEVEGIKEALDMDYCRVAFGHPNPKRGYEEYGLNHHLKMRKPAPGMLLDLMKQAKVERWETMMVGDRDEDRDAAAAAECLFSWTKDFFADHTALLYSAYSQFQALVKTMNRQTLLFQINAEGGGSIVDDYGAYNTMMSWDSLVQAPHLIETTRREWEQAEEERKRTRIGAMVPDDFDPFLDSDDLP